MRERLGRPPRTAELLSTRQQIAARLKRAIYQLYGHGGMTRVARDLGLSDNIWSKYDRGQCIPSHVMLALIDRYRIEPMWLLHGAVPMFRSPLDWNGAAWQVISAAEIALDQIREAG